MAEQAGVVEELLPSGLLAVRLESGERVVASVSAALRRILVRLEAGDRVRVKRSVLDPSRGQIRARID